MRILWADDHVDIAKTLSLCIGGSNEHEIVFVHDGNEALRKAIGGLFDFAVVDLGMPPEPWGGLWLLDQLRKVNCRLPVLILSGEGQLSESLQAEELGARGYVTKESAPTKLRLKLNRVRGELWDEIEAEILTRFPSPLSISYKRYLSGSALQSRMKAIVEIYESALRLTAIVGLAELRAEDSGAFRRGDLKLSRPSMGTWNELCKTLSRSLPPGSACRSLQRTFDDSNISEIIKTRNNVIGHGPDLSELRAQSWIKVQDAALKTWLSRLWQHLQLRVFLVFDSEYDGNVMANNSLAFEGESPVLPRLTLNSQRPLVARKAYLQQNKNSTERFLPLDPLILFQPGNELNSWRSFVLDGWADNRGAGASGSEPLRYIEVWSGVKTDDLGPRLSALPESVWKR